MSTYPYGFTAGDDTLSGDDTLDLIGGWHGNDVIFGLGGGDILFGLTGNDTLFGGLDTDLLVGGDGDDRLLGEAGADTLVGGGGADTFVFGQAAGSDLVQDFDGAAGDRIDRDGLQFTSQAVGGNWELHLADGGVVVLAGVTDFQSSWIV